MSTSDSKLHPFGVESPAELDRVIAILTALNTADTVPVLLDRVFSEVTALCAADAGVLHLYHREGDLLVLEKHHNLSDSLAEAFQTVKLGVGTIGKAAKSKKPEHVEKVEDLGRNIRGFWGERRIAAGISLPVTAAGSLIATITIGVDREGYFDRKRVKLLTDLLGQAAPAINRLNTASALPTAGVSLAKKDPVGMLVEMIDDAVILADAQGVILASNAAASDITGYSATDLKGSRLTALVPDWIVTDQPKDVRRIKRKISEAEDLKPEPFILKDKDGSEYRAVMRMVFCRDREALPFRTAIVISTARGRATAAGAGTGTTDALLDLAACAVFTVDPAGRVLQASAMASEILAYDQGDILKDREFISMVAPEDHGKVIRMLTELPKRKQIAGIECKFQKKNGTRFFAEAGGIYLPGETAETDSATIIVRDISRLKEAERLGALHRGGGFKDSLTGFFNKLFLQSELERLTRDIQRFHPLSIMAISIDGLNLVNEIFGDRAGNEILTAGAALAARPFRKTDIIARTGGNEFCVLLPKTTEKTAEGKKEKLFELVNRYNDENHWIPLTVSAGLATTGEAGRSSEDVHNVLRRANEDLYQNRLLLDTSPTRTAFGRLLEHLKHRDLISAEGRNHYTRLVKILPQAHGLTEENIENLMLMSLCHNMGYIAVPDELLQRPGKLSPHEFGLIKEHPQIGCNIAVHSSTFCQVARLLLHHHERWDGTGYPAGLAGKQIPVECRVFAIIDAFIAMISPRPFRDARTKEEALDELVKCSGTQFDPAYADELVGLLGS